MYAGRLRRGSRGSRDHDTKEDLMDGYEWWNGVVSDRLTRVECITCTEEAVVLHIGYERYIKYVTRLRRRKGQE